MANTWLMWAHLKETPSGPVFWHAGSYVYVKAHGLDDPIVAVEFTEDPAGEYWAWLDKDGDRPHMIWPRQMLYRMCFAYGPEAEEERGRGRTLRLKAKEVKK